MRIDVIVVALAGVFLWLAYFNDAMEVERMWEQLLEYLSASSILN